MDTFPMSTVLIIIAKMLFVPLVSPLCIGVIRKIKARMQNRRGASIVQPYFDLWKLFHKDEVVPHDASWIFKVAPYVLFGVGLLLPLAVPLLSTVETVRLFGDFLVVVYLLALTAFVLALAGIDAGSAFGGFGSSREMTISALTEGTMVFSFLPALLLVHTTNLGVLAGAVAQMHFSGYFPIAIAAFGFGIALLAETARMPFDNPATHLELTMIHEAMVLEYSGKRLALIEWASANKLLFFIVLGANVFLPWGLAHGAITMTALLIALGAIVCKVLIALGAIAFIESRIAKLRYFRLPDLLLTSFILCVVALITVGI